ncbi:hypothetical protein [Allofrancisella frigidaquae]|uniref:Ankyrin repeat domain-containing protein n=1 Tax=Allofrancisella frigidaquae TaxID=1085644 RepID=A0A6M3HVN9_9GAMM|nr:hypothetical protein [Allofrancisella frigidaquae]QIV94272.1 hypothetical protein E3E15_02445 [Allofrancisella frigidaquae]
MKLSLINLQKVLGYEINQDGMCYGIAFMAIQAILRNDFKTYRDRLNLIDSYYFKIKHIKQVGDINEAEDPKNEGFVIKEINTFKIRLGNDVIEYNYKNITNEDRQDIALYWLKHDIEKAQEKRSNKNTRNNLSYNDHQLLNILSWFDGVQIYFGLDKKSLNKDNKYCFGTQDYQKSIDFFKANDGSNIYLHSSNLTIFTEETAQKLYNKITNSDMPIAFLLIAESHCIAIGGCQKQGGYLINHDECYNMTTSSTSAKQIYEIIYKNLYNNSPFNINEEAIYIKEFKNVQVQAQTHNLSYFSIDEKYAKSKPQQVSKLLLLALHEGLTEAVTAYIQIIQNIPELNKQKLLTAEINDGTPGLFMALQNGRNETITAYIKAIKAISGLNIQELLTAKNSDGTPGLFMALQDGEAQAVKAYIDSIKNIPKINKNILLAAKNSDGTPGLFMALQNGQAETVKTYIQAIKDIPELDIQELLTAKIDGIPGLFMALQNGQAETVAAYIQAIKDIPGLDKKQLIAAKRYDKTPGLFMALQNGQAETVAAYLKIEDYNSTYASFIMSSIEGNRKKLKNMLLDWAKTYKQTRNKKKSDYGLLISLLSFKRSTFYHSSSITQSIKKFNAIQYWED